MKEVLEKMRNRYAKSYIWHIFDYGRTMYGATVHKHDNYINSIEGCGVDTRFCFSQTIKQKFIKADITYDIFFSNDPINLRGSLIPSTVFNKEQIEKFIGYFKNVVDFDFSVEMEKAKSFPELMDNHYTDDFRDECDSYSVNFDELEMYHVTIRINDIRPVHAMILQWVRQIFDMRYQLFTAIAYDIKARKETSKLSLFTILGYLNSLTYDLNSTEDMTLFPTTLFEGNISFDKMRDRIKRMRDLFEPFSGTNIYNNQSAYHHNEVPDAFKDYVSRDGTILRFIDDFWYNWFNRTSFVKVLENPCSGSVYIRYKRVNDVTKPVTVDSFFKDYDTLIDTYVDKITWCLSQKIGENLQKTDLANSKLANINTLLTFVEKV